MDHQKLTVGRDVHFYDPSVGDGPLAAKVTKVYSDHCATLAVFVPHATGIYVASSAMRKDMANGMSSYWEWPPRV